MLKQVESFRFMSAGGDREFTHTQLEDSLIKRIWAFKIELKRNDNSQNDEDETLNNPQNKSQEVLNDISNIQEIANKISKLFDQAHGRLTYLSSKIVVT